MAKRRGMNGQERFALDFSAVTADGALVSAPCYVYSILISPLDTNVTGLAIVADTSAAADAVKETAQVAAKTGAGGTSAGGGINVDLKFNPPLYCAVALYADITNTRVAASYALA